MRLSFVVGLAVGYVLGARAGRERYEWIVRKARKVRGSQTIQSTAGVLQGQVSDITAKARTAIGSKMSGGRRPDPLANGFKR